MAGVQESVLALQERLANEQKLVHLIDRIHSAKSLDSIYGLDREAIKAMRRWEFRPGTKEGRPVAAQVSVEMTFNLKE